VTAFSATHGTSALPSFQAILALTKGLPNLPKDQVRKLLEYLTSSIRIEPKKRLLLVTWRLGGESWCLASAGESVEGVERFVSLAQAHLDEYRL